MYSTLCPSLKSGLLTSTTTLSPTSKESTTQLLSGEVACPFCDLPGKCEGGLLVLTLAGSQQSDCEVHCDAYSLCQFYTFDQDNQRCSLYKVRSCGK